MIDNTDTITGTRTNSSGTTVDANNVANNAVNITIRFAESADLNACLSFDNTGSIDTLESAIINHDVIVAQRLGEIVGYVRLQYIWSKIPFISLILIKTEFRGRGIGASMLNYLVEFLGMNGFKVLLSSSQVNEEGPQHWHHKMGFTEAGILCGINEHGIGEVFYKLDCSKE